MKERLIVALDCSALAPAEKLVEELIPLVGIFKVGSELFTAAGPPAVEMIQRRGAKVFLDLKFHDIPNTVARASAEAAGLGVFMFNLHCLGGEAMMKAAVAAARERAEELKTSPPLILGVTLLTSLDDEDLRRVGLEAGAKATAEKLVKSAKRSGLDGVVASGEEIAAVRKVAGRDFIIIVPGIRPKGVFKDDQKRTVTPAEAIAAGADYIVVGRPITAAPRPGRAAEAIIRELEE